jgi:micrococcal nuclease|tara:strand:- start:16486 stop:16956 length:471 start_codon:yes stop_codon:yes gene_type:complete
MEVDEHEMPGLVRKVSGGMIRALAALLVLFPVTVQAADVSGAVTHVRDGDTIEVEGIAVRLQGVSAPERGHALYDKGKAFMARLVMGQAVRCELDGTRTHDRVVGICYLDGRDIGAEVIRAGLALDCPRFSKGRYRDYETPGARQAIKLPAYCRPR